MALAVGAPLAVAGIGCHRTMPAPAPGGAHMVHSPDFLRLAEPRPQLLMLGTFHFSNPGLDVHKNTHAMNVLAPERQREIEHLVRGLARFEPTRIAVEVPPNRQRWLDSLYGAYRAGRYTLGSNEVFQLAFRLAAILGHDRVYAIDAPEREYTPEITSQLLAARAHELGQDSLLHSPWRARYEARYQWEDSLEAALPLADFLRLLNDPQRVNDGHGSYLVGTFRIGADTSFEGADAATAWYNRNLRTFANIQRIPVTPNDRILLIIGAGHLPILQFVARASPEFRLVSVDSYLR